MASIIYSLCALTAALCAWQLLRSYYVSKNRLLLWGGICFLGLTLNNVLVFIDELVIPDRDLSTERLGVAFLSMSMLLYGLIWDTE